MIKDETMQTFLDQLASDASTPGGGSAGAVLGAIGAALLSMVANLTVGKKAHADVEETMRAALAASEALRERLTAMIEEDVRVFEGVMEAYRMPRATDAERAERSAAIQAALKEAAAVPLACAAACAEVVRLGETVGELGNPNVISDVGVGVLAAHAALRSAALNVYINTGAIKDEAFVQRTHAELEAIMEGAGERTGALYELVKGRL